MIKKHVIGTVAVLLAVIIPICFFIGMNLSLTDTYSETFVAELGAKFDRLCSISEPKLIVIGGSSVAFGLDSAALEKHLGMPAVNFGLYATLGTKLMMDLSQANINSGDIIILSPEIDAQTLSLYFNAQAAWQAMESNMSMLRYIGPEDRAAMVGAYYNYAVTKFRYGVEGVTLSPTGVYRSDSFNEYGDISYDRPRNALRGVTGLAYDTENLIELTTDIVSEDFIDYVNDYTEWCEKRGAAVYFSFCPMNKSALAEGTDSETMTALFDYFSRKLDCKVINSPADTVYEAAYFYDTNFHLNNAGVSLHTKGLIEAIYREQGLTENVNMKVLKKPALPVYIGDLGTDGNQYAGCFVYEKYGSGYCIVGTTDAAKSAQYLEIPSSYDGLAVLAIGSGAFAGCDKLTEIKIYKNITAFKSGAFSGISGKLTVYMDVEDADYMTDTATPLPQVSPDLLDGANAELRFCFTEKCFERYIGDYNWQQFGELFDIGSKD